MNALNQVIIEGNVVRQPERRTCKNGSSFCAVPIATNRSYKGSDGNYVNDVSYFDISTFGPMAELCEKWCPKGRGIRVVGRLKQSVWKTEEGKNKSKIEIIAEHVEFKPLFKKNSETSEDEGPASADSKNATLSKKQKLALLKEAAQAAQNESEDSDEEVEAVF